MSTETHDDGNDVAQESAGIRKVKVSGATLYLLPEVMIQLNIELGEYAEAHREVREYLARVTEATGPKADWITKLSAVAAYCGILMDGTYDAAALNTIAEKCLQDLQARRTISIKLS